MMPSCFSYGYISTAEERADQTLTHVQCQVSAGFGQMFPYPPEAMANMTAAPTDDANAPSKSLEVQPTDGDGDGTSTGTIVGAVVGVIVALVVIAALAAWFIIRRRRHRREAELDRAAAALDMAAGGGSKGSGALRHDDDKDLDRHRRGDGARQPGSGKKNRPGFGMGRLRPLSTIQEQHPSPVTSPLSAGAGAGAGAGAAIAAMRGKRKSARRSQGPAWPIGSGNPLASHPVSCPLPIKIDLPLRSRLLPVHFPARLARGPRPV